MDTHNVTLASVVSARLDELKWSLQRGADETGISYRHFHRIVSDERYRPYRSTIDKLSVALGIPRSTLLLAVYQQEMLEPAGVA